MLRCKKIGQFDTESQWNNSFISIWNILHSYDEMDLDLLSALFMQTIATIGHTESRFGGMQNICMSINVCHEYHPEFAHLGYYCYHEKCE